MSIAFATNASSKRVDEKTNIPGHGQKTKVKRQPPPYTSKCMQFWSETKFGPIFKNHPDLTSRPYSIGVNRKCL